MIERTEVFNLFLSQAQSHGFSLVGHPGKWLLDVQRKGTLYHAVVIVESFDYYRLRYHLAGKPPDLIICWRHSTLLAVPCFALSPGYWHRPNSFPKKYEGFARRATAIGSQCLIGGLLIGSKRAQDILNDLPQSTRYAYLDKLSKFSRRKRGRPVAA